MLSFCVIDKLALQTQTNVRYIFCFAKLTLQIVTDYLLIKIHIEFIFISYSIFIWHFNINGSLIFMLII